MMLIKHTCDKTVKQLRWVMVGAIMLTTIFTLCAQPNTYWLHPETAIRFDGLSVFNKINHSFDFLLSKGWYTYLAAKLVYIVAVFLLIGILPKRVAMVVAFSFIFVNYYITGNWLAVSWHMGFTATVIYAFILGGLIVWALFPLPAEIGTNILKKLKWFMIAAMLSDGICTLIGQPLSFWHHPETAYEGNPFFRWFLFQGWWAYVLIDIAYCCMAFVLVSVLSKRQGLILVFVFVFIHYLGATNWFFYVWRMGMELPVIYGTLLSLIIVLLLFQRRPKMI